MYPENLGIHLELSMGWVSCGMKSAPPLTVPLHLTHGESHFQGHSGETAGSERSSGIRASSISFYW